MQQDDCVSHPELFVTLCGSMRLSVFALIWFAGAAAVSGFVSHVIPARLDRSLRTAHKGIPPAERSAYQLPPLLPRSSPQHSVVMTQDEPELDLNLKSSQEPQRGRVLLGMANLYSTPKVALLGAAAVATTQLLPHAAVAAETAIPLVSGAVGDSFMEKLTSSGFFQAFSLVFVSEIGDKTFFIAALLAAKTSRLISFAGSVGALAIMTVLAVLLGLAFHSVPSVFTSGLPLDDIIAAAAFLYFGINTLKDAYELPDNSNTGIDEERAEAEESVKELGGKKTVW